MFITIPPKEEASSKGRLEKLLLLTVNSSLKTTLESLKTDEDEDMELVAKDVALSVRRNKISEERLAEAEVATSLYKGVKLEGEIIGGDRKRVREYTERMEQRRAPSGQSLFETGVSWSKMLKGTPKPWHLGRSRSVMRSSGASAARRGSG